MNIDWKQANTGEFEVYPKATYHVQIVSWEKVKASTGTPQIRWKVEILSPEEYRGKSILEHTALTPASLWRLANFIRGCGVDTTQCEKMDVDGAAFTKILNLCKERKSYWLVDQETGKNGKLRNVIVDYRREPDIAPIDAALEIKTEW